MEETLETLEISPGNTKTPVKSKQPLQRMHWCFTWNNYKPNDIETLETLFKHLCHKYAFQEEIGEDKQTPHLQGVMSLKKRARWSEFGLPLCIHWEPCAHLTRAYEYCTKDETRVAGTRPYTLNYELPFKQEIKTLFQWEKDIINIINGPKENRSIYWFWEPNGCAGKTTFQKYLVGRFEGVLALSGKGSDMKHGVISYKNTTGIFPKIILINFPRSLDKDYISWTGIEEVKDMFFYSPKYEGGMVVGPSPFVFCFANEFPNTDKMSPDRWKIRMIT